MKHFSIALFIAFALFSCSKKSTAILDPILKPVNGILKNLSLVQPKESTLKDMPFKFGASVSIDLLRSNASYKALVIKEYSSLTAENAMKFWSLHPTENTYNWAAADEIVAFAQANGKRMHGHTLNWHEVPGWVTNFSGDKAAWENLLKTHIQTVVTHFKGKVASWDVVNEAIDEDGGYRNTIWVQKLGTDYIARAFRYVHEADPSALLFYNDYGHDYSPIKRTAILNLVNDLKRRGVPIHGIGLQMHTRYNQPDEDITSAITSAAATGLLVHISELDITVNPNSDKNLTYTAILAEQQAAKYKFIVKTYNAIPKAQQFGITTWNVTDGDSWIPGTYARPDWPLPFDANYKRKPAYQGILDGVK